MTTILRRLVTWIPLLLCLIVTTLVYWPGLSGGWLFDDYSNIVDNAALRVHDLQLSTLVHASLSSGAGLFRRPLTMLSFALNFAGGGLNPFPMKLTNLLIHLVNGALAFWLATALLSADAALMQGSGKRAEDYRGQQGQIEARIRWIAAVIAGGWMLLPINLTAVLYVVQRMESLANVFVFAGLIAYVHGRVRMLNLGRPENAPHRRSTSQNGGERAAFFTCIIALVVFTALGLLAKETAAMLPLYACTVEWALFRFQRLPPATNDIGLRGQNDDAAQTKNVPAKQATQRDRRIVLLFVLTLVVPFVIGIAWLAPGLLSPTTWASRDFDLQTRLLTEARIVVDYMRWTILPTREALSFYHDSYVVSTGLLTPWTTLASILLLAALACSALLVRARMPLMALGIALFLGAQLMTATIIPLELIYEHRNYFASFGVLLGLVPLLTSWRKAQESLDPVGSKRKDIARLVGRGLMAILLLLWLSQTALRSYIWGAPLRLARDLATLAPDSSRAQYDLGRSYSISTNYHADSPFTPLAYRALEHAASMKNASILPEQALIFMASRMDQPVKEAWWTSMVSKLRTRPTTVEDRTALDTLSICAIRGRCDVSQGNMAAAFTAALSQPGSHAELYAEFGQYAWYVMHDRKLGIEMMSKAVSSDPRNSGYPAVLSSMQKTAGTLE